MLEFIKVDLCHRDEICSALEYSDYQGCEYTFCNMYSWSCISQGYFAKDKGGMYVYCGVSTKATVFLFPFGKGDIRSAIDNLISYCENKAMPFKMVGISKENKELLSSVYPDRFSFSEERNTFDYIYKSSDLINLPGKKYHSKRNHIAKFLKTPHSFEAVSESNIDNCYEILEKWMSEREDHQNKSKDICAVGRMLKNFNKLGIDGIIVRKDGIPVAFSLGEKLNSNTYVVHAEKAVSGADGVYQFINQQMVNMFAKSIKFVNREDDAGSEGLRKAKLSYKPEYLLEKYSAVLAD